MAMKLDKLYNEIRTTTELTHVKLKNKICPVVPSAEICEIIGTKFRMYRIDCRRQA